MGWLQITSTFLSWQPSRLNSLVLEHELFTICSELMRQCGTVTCSLFFSKSLHNPNKCLTFAPPEPPSLLTMLKSGVVLFLYHYERLYLSLCDLSLFPAVLPYCGSLRLKRKRQKRNKSVKVGCKKRNKSVKTGAQKRNKSVKMGAQKRNKSYFLFPRDEEVVIFHWFSIISLQFYRNTYACAQIYRVLRAFPQKRKRQDCGFLRLSGEVVHIFILKSVERIHPR